MNMKVKMIRCLITTIVSLIISANALASKNASLLDTGLWGMAPQGTDNPSANAKLERTSEGLCITIPDAGKGMKWFANPLWPNLNRFPYLAVRYRAEGLYSGGDLHFFWASGSGGAKTILPYSEIISDGKWHWAAVADIGEKVGTIVNSLMLYVQAKDPNCKLWISDMGFRSELPPDVNLPKKPQPEYRQIKLPDSVLQKLRNSAGIAGDINTVVLGVKRPKEVVGCSTEITPPMDLNGIRYLIVDYQIRGAKLLSTEPLLWISNKVVLWQGELICDGQSRQIAVDLKQFGFKDANSIRLQLQGESPDAQVVLKNIHFANRAMVTQTLEQLLPAGQLILRNADAITVDISKSYNCGLKELTGGSLSVSNFAFAKNKITASGVPFVVGTDKQNVTACEGAVGTYSIAIPKSSQIEATEAYLLMAADFPPTEELAYGDAYPVRVRHPHRFNIQVCYSDGSSETIFPLRLMTRLPEIFKGLEVYVIPLAKKTAVQLMLNDNMRLGEFGICGVTLNKGVRKFDESLWMAKSTEFNTVPQAKQSDVFSDKPKVYSKDDKLIFENKYLYLSLGGQSGVISQIQAGGIKKNILTGDVPLFKVSSWDEKTAAASSEYKLASKEIKDKTATLKFVSATEAFPDVELVMAIDKEESVSIEASLKNKSATQQRWILSLPAGMNIKIGANDYYSYPAPYLFISDVNHVWDMRYYGWGVLDQYMDVSDTVSGRGLCVITKDVNATDRNFYLSRDAMGTTMGVRWRLLPIAGGATFKLPAVDFVVHGDSWRGGYDKYMEWVKTWYKPLVPRKDWFRKCFALRQTYTWEGLWDKNTDTYHFARQLEKIKQPFGDCDYMHIYGWGMTKTRGIYGDYDPWGETLGKPEAFRNAITEFQDKQKVPVGLYLVPFTDDDRSNIGKAHKDEWGIRDKNGKLMTTSIDGPTATLICPGIKARKDFVVELLDRVYKQTNALGYYLDVWGSGAEDCYATNHDHPPDWRTLPGEMETIKAIRLKLPPDRVVYTEHTSVDVQAVNQDGGLNYSMCNYEGNYHGFPLGEHLPVPVRLGRFIFPDFKVFQFGICSFPNTCEETYKLIFFNGDAFFLWGDSSNWFAETLKPIQRSIKVLKEHEDAFSGDDCQPLVPTLVKGVFANRFSGKKETAWTVYNANFRSVSGEIIAVPHIKGAKYFDAWNGVELKPRISEKTAYIKLTIGPHDVGCIVRKTSK